MEMPYDIAGITYVFWKLFIIVAFCFHFHNNQKIQEQGITMLFTILWKYYKKYK